MVAREHEVLISNIDKNLPVVFSVLALQQAGDFSFEFTSVTSETRIFILFYQSLKQFIVLLCRTLNGERMTHFVKCLLP